MVGGGSPWMSALDSQVWMGQIKDKIVWEQPTARVYGSLYPTPRLTAFRHRRTGPAFRPPSALPVLGFELFFTGPQGFRSRLRRIPPFSLRLYILGFRRFPAISHC